MKSWWMIAAVGLIPAALAGCDETPLEAAQEVDALQSLQEAPGEAGFGPAGGILALSDELGLSDEQMAEIESILSELAEENAPLLEGIERPEGPPSARGPGGGTPNPALQQVRENTREAMAAIQAVLTEEQRELARTLRPERGPGAEGRRGAGRGGPGFAAGGGVLRLADALELTADQVASIEAIQTSLRERMEAAREELAASGEEPMARRLGGGPDPVMLELRQEAEAATEEILALLTDEQRAALEEIQAERPERNGIRQGRRGRPAR